MEFSILKWVHAFTLCANQEDDSGEVIDDDIRNKESCLNNVKQVGNKNACTSMMILNVIT